MDEAAQDILESEMPQVDLTKPIKSKRKKPSVNQNAPPPEELERQMEALLFASARRVTVDEIAKLLNASEKDVEEAFKRLKQDYDNRNTSLMLLDEDRGYKFTIREAYMPIVQNVVVETELSKSVLETLAIIAYKHPCLQSEVTRIRTNKAYDHLHELEQLGYISREPHGRTRKIKLTPKFFEYFDLPKDKLKESFAAFEAVERAIGDQEAENDRLKKEIKTQEKEAKDEAELQREQDEKEVEKLGDLEVFEEEVHKKRSESQSEKVGKLQVYQEKKKKEKKKDDEDAGDDDVHEGDDEDGESDEGSDEADEDGAGDESQESNQDDEDASQEDLDEDQKDDQDEGDDLESDDGEQDDSEQKEEPESSQEEREGSSDEKPSEKKKPKEESPKPTSASYKKFLESQKVEETKHADFKKAERPLIAGSEDQINARVNAILGGSSKSETDNPHLAGISSDDKDRAKNAKAPSEIEQKDNEQIEHVADETEEGVDLIEHAQKNRSPSEAKASKKETNKK